MKFAKRIGSLICVFLICFTLAVPSIPAHATGGLVPQSFGAWISAGLVSLQIIGQSLLPAPGPIDPYYQWLASPASSSQEYEYPVGSSVIQDYLNASTIVVNKGVTTIDGVEYDEVFVEPGTFTRGLKTNLFDFKTKWNIISGQSGITLAQGVGHYNGLGLYNVSGLYKTPSIILPNGYTGNLSFGNGIVYKSSKNSSAGQYKPIPGQYYSYGFNAGVGEGQFFIIYKNGSYYGRAKLTNTSSYTDTSALLPELGDLNPFNYGYTSGIVPSVEADIPDNYGLSIQIPHDQLQTFYNTYPEYNVDNSVINIQQEGIDIDQLTQSIFDLITSMEEIRAEWRASEEPEPPEPPGPADEILEGINTIIGQQNTQISQNQTIIRTEQQQVQRQQQQIQNQQQQIQNQQQQIQNQQQQIQEQQQINENTSDIKDAIESVIEVPASDDLPDFKFDLRELFPFCIPFDIYRLLSSFDAEPEAPHVQLPIVINSINFRYNLDLDFSAWNSVAQAMRTAELIVYAIGLAWATGKVIKW